jgi:HEAT repeat protein
VVAKAVAAVGEADVPAADELAVVADRVPELAVQALRTMAKDSSARTKAVPHLRTLTGHADPSVRAAAVLALVEATQSNVSAELEAAFQDADTQVRQAAAIAVSSAVPQTEASPTRILVDTVPAGISERSAIVGRWRAPLEKMLSAQEPRERLVAAKALLGTEATDTALAVLKDLARDQVELRGEVAESLGLLEWKEREDLYTYLTGLELAQDDYQLVLLHFAEGAPVNALHCLWAAVDGDPRALRSLAAVHSALLTMYLGSEGRYTPSKRSPVMLRHLANEAVKRLEASDKRVRTLALALLSEADQKQATEKAEELFAAAETSATMRRNALAVLMFFRPADQVDRAVAACSSSDPAMRVLGLTFLAGGSDNSYSRSLMVDGDALYLSGSPGTAYKVSRLPEGLSTQVLTPLLSDGRADVRVSAAYLLARLGEAAGVQILAAAWREGQGTSVRNYLVEAIATLDDDSLTSLLEEVYNSMDREEDVYSIREFYQSIHAMKGPKVLALRKRIREEVGMDRLR